MAFTSTDWTINYTNKTVTNNDSGVGTNLPSALGTYAKVGPILEFFQWLATEFASTGQMDDTYPIQSDTPTVYKWLNGWTFGHADDYKYLNGGSIEDPSGSGTATADSLWSNLYSIGSQTTGTLLYMIQNDIEVAPWWISGNIDILVLVKDAGAWTQSPDTGGTPTNGGVWFYAREFGDTYDHGFSNLSAGGSNPLGINTALDSGNKSGELFLTVADETGFVPYTFVKGGTSGAVGKIAKIDTANNYIYLNAVRGGPFVISETLTEYSDREAQTATGELTTNDGTTAFTDVVAGYTDISIAFVHRDFTGGTTGSGPFVFGEIITQTTSGATGVFVAEVSDILYVEDTAGTFDGTNLLTGGTSGATYTPTTTSAKANVDQDLNNGAGAQPYNLFVGETTRALTEQYEWFKYVTRYGSVSSTYTINSDDGQEYRSAIEGTYTDVKVSPFGTIAGTTFYGARGVWVAEYTTADFVLIDADGVEQSPPNYQKVDATHPSLSGCNLFVAEVSAGIVIKDQYTVSSSTATTIDATATIDINKVPQSGVLRVGDDQYTYTGHSGVQFIGVSPDPSSLSNEDFYVPLLDVLADATQELSDNVIYNADISVITSVRKYGFKPYDVETTFGSGGLAFSPILTVDPQAS